MIRSLRKYNKWFMVGFAVLLMLAWLQGPSTRVASQLADRTVGKLDGKKIKGSDMALMQRELHALHEMSPGLIQNVFGSSERDSTHWLLLTREAEEGGFVGDVAAGERFLDDLAQQMAAAELQNNFQLQIQLMQAPDRTKAVQEVTQRIAGMVKDRAQQSFGRAQFNSDEMGRALARAGGVLRMMNSFQVAPRLSDRRAVGEARKTDDGAVVDDAFLPASALTALVPEPDAAALQAHFEKFKGNKPGAGDYGVGYLLPSRVRLEYLTLDRKAIEDAVPVDAVEVRKRYTQNHPSVYQGDFAAERARVEADIKAEQASKLMQEAQVIIQSEVSKATRKLDRDGRYRKVPADWEASRPQLSAVAAAVQSQVSQQSGVPFPLPAVTVKSQWLTTEDLAALPGLGRGTLRQGGLDVPFTQVVGWTRELKGAAGEGPIAVQVGIPLAENFLVDGTGNRYYVTVLGTREESAPDSVEEIREKAVKDYKEIQAFESLRARADEFRAALMSGGVEAAATAFAATQLPEGKTPEKPKVEVATRVQRQRSNSPALNRDAAMTAAIIDAAAQLDPKAAPDSHPPEKATLVYPSAKALGLGVVKIRAFVPLSREDFARIDRMAVMRATGEELPQDLVKNSFSLDALLKRHVYLSGDERVHSAKELKGADKDEVAG